MKINSGNVVWAGQTVFSLPSAAGNPSYVHKGKDLECIPSPSLIPLLSVIHFHPGR